MGEESEDLITEIQKATDAGANRDSSQEKFLKHLKEDVPTMVSENLDVDKVKVDIQDVNIEEAAATVGPVTEEATNCQTLKVGEIPLPNDHRIHQHGSGLRASFKVETRQHRRVAYIDFCSPTLGEIWGEVRECAIGAIAASLVAAIFSGAGVAAFYPAFYGCLAAKIGADSAKAVVVNYRGEDWHSCWSNHC